MSVLAVASTMLLAGVWAESTGSAAVAGSAAETAVAPSPEQQAWAKAASTGTRVALAARTTEREVAYANPDGSTTVEVSAEPVRAQVGQSWVPLDLSLVERGGRVEPTVAAVDVAFSPGGATPMASVVRDGTTATVGWRGVLPEPVLEGSSARYVNVYPDVDLVLTAVPDGFRQVLVVKSRAAAANPAVREVAFDLATGAGSIEPRGRGFAVIGRRGTEVLTSTSPLMWDSAGGQSERGDSDLRPERLIAPQTRDQVADMDATLSSSTAVLTADTTMLDSADTVYPVYLDPPVSASQYSRGMIDSAYPTQSHPGWTGDLGVGYNNYEIVTTKRLLFRFNTPSAAKNKQLISATLTGDMVYASQCNTIGVQAWRIAGFSSSATWNNFSDISSSGSWRQQLTTTATLATNCFPKSYDFNVTAGVNLASTLQNLGLKGSSETNPLGWRRFESDVRLSITYNSIPSTPSPTEMTTKSPSTTCVSGPVRPVVNDNTPTLVAFLKDADAGQTIKGEFHLQSFDPVTSLWSTGIKATTAAKTPNADFETTTVPLTNGYVYRWHARAVETTTGYTSGSYSTAWCEMEIDTSAPDAPGLERLTSAPVVGQQVTYQVTLPAGSVSAKWSANVDVAMTAVSAANWQFSYTPTTPGPQRIRVWAFDAASNPSPQAMDQFDIVATGATDRWPLNEASGTTAGNTHSGSGRLPLTLSSGFARLTLNSFVCGPEDAPDCVDWTDRALDINSSTPRVYGDAAQKVDTTTSFTVMAKVHPAAGSGEQSAVQQSRSSSTSTFSLGATSVGVDPSNPAFLNINWDFSMRDADSNVLRTSCLQSGVPSDKWTHLTGRYNAASHALEILIDGQSGPICDGSEPTLGAVPPSVLSSVSTSGLNVGQKWYGSSGGYAWQGDVDEVVTLNGYMPDDVVVRYRDAAPNATDL